MEVTAAFLTGSSPTFVDNSMLSSSGGLKNAVRLLENWSRSQLRLRHGTCILFTSEIQNERWSTSYYSPPQRDFGYYGEFAVGRLPPGTPLFRTGRIYKLNPNPASVD